MTWDGFHRGADRDLLKKVKRTLEAKPSFRAGPKVENKLECLANELGLERK